MQRVSDVRRVPVTILLLLIALHVSRACSAQQASLQVTSRTTVSSIERFYGLSQNDARSGLPVRIEGTVLYSDPHWHLFWLKDETGRLFIPLPPEVEVPPARTRAIVTGTTTFKDGNYRIEGLKIQRTGPASLPAPRPLMPLKLDDQKRLEDRVSVTGTIIEAEVRDDRHLRLVIGFLNRFQVRVTIANCESGALPGLLGAKVEVAGCASPLGDDVEAGDDRLIAQQVFVPDLKDLTVFKGGPDDPFSAPVVPIEALGIERRQHRDPRLIRVCGNVTSKPAPNVLVVNDGQSTVEVRLRVATELTEGADVEVAGSLWLDDDKVVFIDRALARPATAASDAEKESIVELPVIRSAHGLHGLTREMASRKYPVEIQAVVIYCDPEWRVLFLHDGQRGFYVDCRGRKHRFIPGDRVLIRGFSDPGGFAPMVVARWLQKQGRGEVPAPRTVSPGRLLSGAEDSQWLTLGGTIESVERSQKNLVISLSSESGNFEAVICGAGKLLKQRNWLGSDVLLTGVCGVKSNADFQVTGIYFHVPDVEHVEFRAEASGDPFAIPQIPIAKLMAIEAGDSGSADRVRISGVVTYVDRSGLVAIQDDSRGILVRFKTQETPQVSDVVDLIGFPVARSFSPEFRISAWRKIGPAAVLPAPKAMSVSEIENAEMDGQLVSIEATVLRNNSNSAAPGLTLQADGVVFSAELASSTTEPRWQAVKEQSVVRVQGVLDIRADGWERLQSFRLLCPLNADVQTIQHAPWWTSRTATTLVTGLVVLVALVVVWGIALRTTIVRQTRRLQHELTARAELSTKHQALIENAGELIFSIRQTGEFVSVNPATERAFDAPDNQLLDQPIAKHLTEDSGELFNLVISRLTTGQPHAVLELTTKRELVLEAAVRLETQQSGEHEVQCIARDVSERRQLEDQVRQMQKMESVGQLAAGVAHDYNNLLAVVCLNSERMLRFSKLSEKDAESISVILNAAENAASLTQQLLAFSRRQAMNPTMLHLDELLPNIVEMLRRLIGDNIELQLSVEDGVPAIHADESMIQQAVINLAINSRDAMPDGGTLSISVGSVTIPTEIAAQDAEAVPGEYVTITVTDTGLGIEKDVLPNVFEPFFTTKDVGKGTGLGLSTVHGIAKQHEGWVHVESTPGSGSRFEILLPVNHSAARQEAGEQSHDASPDSRGHETILVVEDDSSVRLAICQVLESAGYQLIQSVNGVEALEMVGHSASDIDLVITDMVMPGGMTGAEMAKEIRAVMPRIPIIFCTGYSAELADLASLSESERLLRKPFTGSHLLHVVQELLNAAAAAPQAITTAKFAAQPEVPESKSA